MPASMVASTSPAGGRFNSTAIASGFAGESALFPVEDMIEVNDGVFSGDSRRQARLIRVGLLRHAVGFRVTPSRSSISATAREEEGAGAEAVGYALIHDDEDQQVQFQQLCGYRHQWIIDQLLPRRW